MEHVVDIVEMFFLVVSKAVNLQILFRVAHERVEGVLLCDLDQGFDGLFDIWEERAFRKQLLEYL